MVYTLLPFLFVGFQVPIFKLHKKEKVVVMKSSGLAALRLPAASGQKTSVPRALNLKLKEKSPRMKTTWRFMGSYK